MGTPPPDITTRDSRAESDPAAPPEARAYPRGAGVVLEVPIPADWPNSSATFSPDGRGLLVLNEGGTLTRWSLDLPSSGGFTGNGVSHCGPNPPYHTRWGLG